MSPSRFEPAPPCLPTFKRPLLLDELCSVAHIIATAKLRTSAVVDGIRRSVIPNPALLATPRPRVHGRHARRRPAPQELRPDTPPSGAVFRCRARGDR